MPLIERDVETLIDNQLRNLNWIDDPKNKNRNVFKQQVKTEEQKRKLERKKPDYVLYQSHSDKPLIIIEAKKPGESIEKALDQGVGYANQIEAPIVYATNGVDSKTLHIKKQAPLFLNNEEIDDLIQESTALNFLQDNIYDTIDKKVIKSRQELIAVFNSVNEDFRRVGVHAGLPRIDIFCNILFLKVISHNN